MRITIDYNGSILSCKVTDEGKDYDSIASLSPLKQEVALNMINLTLKGYKQNKKLKKLGFKDRI